MSNRITQRLKSAMNALLATAGIAAIAAPLALGALRAPFIRAQSTGSGVRGKSRPAFEVASVKPIDPASMSRGHEGHHLDRERFVDRTELLQYIVRAYLGGSFCVMTATPPMGQNCALISGALPSWVKTERYEIQAKMPANSVPSYTLRQTRFVNTPELNVMLQVLLEDRFRLQVHWERKELRVYALTVAKNAPKLKRTPAEGALIKAADGSVIEVHGTSGINSLPTLEGSRRMRLDFRASSMQDAADAFAVYFDRPVLDRTGLKGDYDFIIQYEDDPDTRIPLNPFSGLTPSALSNALQTIGLKLESTKAAVEVLVIDHVEKPSEN